MNHFDPQQLEISVTSAASLIESGARVFDLRDDNERQLGALAGAVFAGVEEIGSILTALPPDDQGTTLIMCAKGMRSEQAAKALREAGFERVYSVMGGFTQWSSTGLKVERPGGLNQGQADRYARQLVLPQVGARGQRKLLDARVLLIGMGGLNSPASLYLAAAGVGTLGLVDDDRVERSNLQRQILYSDAMVSELKTHSAKSRLGGLNPDVELELIDRHVDASNVDETVGGWDLIIDGTDNFESRYVVSDACVRQRIPLVYGAVMSFQGQVSVFWPAAGDEAHSLPIGSARPPCYRCLFPLPPAPGEAPNCSVAGVLGVVPGIVGTLQANEALKLILGIGTPLIGRLLIIDVLNLEFREARISAKADCSCQPGNSRTVP